ncbi:T9SS type A sorting domain-containing protein, partial [bacterium]|nr:T9SS type A sorting domain-containing protein [bacterium]
ADQDPDLFIGEGVVPNPPYPGLHYFENRGTPQSAYFVEVTDDLVPGNYNVAIRPFLIDIDADQDNDIFMSDNNGDFFFAENYGTPTDPSFTSAVTYWQGINFSGNTYFCFFDIDSDSDYDLLFLTGTDYDRYVVMYHNIGTTQIPSFDLQPDTIISNLSYIGYFDGIDVNDIDNDGDGDLFLGTGNNGGILFFRNTTGDTSAVQPRLSLDPHHGIQFSIGPNPANPITWISYNLPYPQKAEIAVYNLLGQKVAILASGLQMPGQRTVIWDAANYSSGQYFVRLETENPNAGLGTIRLQSQVERVVVVK